MVLGSAPGAAQAALGVDIHAHFGPPDWLSDLAARNDPASATAAALKDWPAARMIEEMDRAGIQFSMLSLTAPGVWSGDNAQARRLARTSNEFAARIVAEHPRRFGLFAVLPLPDIEGSLREIAYGFDTLKADGIQVFTSTGNIYIGDPRLNPVFEELNRRNAVVFVHPTNPACCSTLLSGIPATVIEGQTDTTRAIAGMIFSGASQRYPNIHMVFCHAGGTMPSVNERLILLAKSPRYQQVVQNGFLSEAAKFYYDTATTSNTAAMSAIRKLIPPSHIVFGTDFPFRGISDQLQALRASGVFAAAELDAIDRSNAIGLLPRIRSLT